MGFLSKARHCVAAARRYMCTHVSEATFETKPYKLYLLDEGPAAKVTLTRNDAIHLYSEMYTIRRMETTAAALYRSKVIIGFCHLYNGQEAVAVGFKASFRPDDCVITSYRAHGWTYVMGVPVVNILGELTGKKIGCSGGKGGSMHMYAPNFFGGNGIVGAQVPLGLGVALALKLQGKNGTCITLYGDGAANQGQVFESFNMAKLWNIPCIFVCENNLYGMGTTVDRSSALTEFYKRGQYIPGIRIDAMDVLTVREGAKFAINYVTKNQSPLIIEAATYRYYGHSMSDPGTSYRNRDEVAQVRTAKDPIIKLREKMLTLNLVTTKELTVIETQIKLQIEEAARKAKAADLPPLKTLTADIYTNAYINEIRNVMPFDSLKHVNIGKNINY